MDQIVGEHEFVHPKRAVEQKLPEAERNAKHGEQEQERAHPVARKSKASVPVPHALKA